MITENHALDIIYKLSFSNKDQEVKSTDGRVSVFAYDNAYMRKEGLYIKAVFKNLNTPPIPATRKERPVRSHA